MEGLITSVGQWLLTQGWIGIAFLVLSGFVYLENRRCAGLADEIRLLNRGFSELQEKRVSDAQENADKDREVIRGNTAALTAITELVRQIPELIRGMR